ncbi:MAG: hypothetical protein AVDCRST_MAG89-5409, partial [uncultured Gemmatimonadetes bacterium]
GQHPPDRVPRARFRGGGLRDAPGARHAQLWRGVAPAGRHPGRHERPAGAAGGAVLFAAHLADGVVRPGGVPAHLHAARAAGRRGPAQPGRGARRGAGGGAGAHLSRGGERAHHRHRRVGAAVRAVPDHAGLRRHLRGELPAAGRRCARDRGRHGAGAGAARVHARRRTAAAAGARLRAPGRPAGERRGRGAGARGRPALRPDRHARRADRAAARAYADQRAERARQPSAGVGDGAAERRLHHLSGAGVRRGARQPAGERRLRRAGRGAARVSPRLGRARRPGGGAAVRRGAAEGGTPRHPVDRGRHGLRRGRRPGGRGGAGGGAGRLCGGRRRGPGQQHLRAAAEPAARRGAGPRHPAAGAGKRGLPRAHLADGAADAGGDRNGVQHDADGRRPGVRPADRRRDRARAAGARSRRAQPPPSPERL